MRLALSLAAVLATAVSAPHLELKPATKYKGVSIRGFPDGAIISFYFKHVGKDDTPERVNINFYDSPHIEIDQVYDISAHIRIDRDQTNPVVTGTYVDGKWTGEMRKEQPLDGEIPSNGWWRVDVIKLDKTRLNIFFQGFWSDVRTFEKNLDNVKTIYIFSDYVDHDNVDIRMKLPNEYLVPLSYDQFKDFQNGDMKRIRNLISFSGFPILAHIEMTTFMRASGGDDRDKKRPALGFGPGSGNYFFKIYQKWSEGTEELRIASNDIDILCTNEKPNGDLQHLILERTHKTVVKLLAFRMQSNVSVSCNIDLPADVADFMDEPFSIWSHEGAHLLHVDHSIPRDLVVKKPKSLRELANRFLGINEED